MADAKISALTAASALDGTEVVPVVQGGVTKKAVITRFDTRFSPIPFQSGRFYRLPNGLCSTAATFGNGILRATPYFIPSTITLDRLGAEVTIIGDVGSKLRLGIYSDDGTFRPGALLLDAGTIAGDSATSQTVTISQQLTRGWYWFVAVVQVVTVTQPTLRSTTQPYAPIPIDYTAAPASGAAAVCFTASAVTGSLPDPFPAITGVNSSIPMLYCRVA